jgi:hypothetical protein
MVGGSRSARMTCPLTLQAEGHLREARNSEPSESLMLMTNLIFNKLSGEQIRTWEWGNDCGATSLRPRLQGLTPGLLHH